MRDREGFSLTTNKDVAWTKENGLWPEGPIDDKGVAVNISASKGIGGLVAAALRVAVEIDFRKMVVQIARIYKTTTQKNRLRCNAYVPK